jgi:hypothetical protein
MGEATREAPVRTEPHPTLPELFRVILPCDVSPMNSIVD